MSPFSHKAAGHQTGRAGSGGRCLPEGPRPFDSGTQRREDELTVWVTCRAINQDGRKETGRLLSPRGQRLWDTQKPFTYLPVMASGWPPQHEVTTKQTISHSQWVEVKDLHPRGEPSDDMLSGILFRLLVHAILQELLFLPSLYCEKPANVSIILPKLPII